MVDKIDDELAPKCLNSELSIDQQFSLCEAFKVDAFQFRGQWRDNFKHSFAHKSVI